MLDGRNVLTWIDICTRDKARQNIHYRTNERAGLRKKSAEAKESLRYLLKTWERMTTDCFVSASFEQNSCTYLLPRLHIEKSFLGLEKKDDGVGKDKQLLQNDAATLYYNIVQV